MQLAARDGLLQSEANDAISAASSCGLSLDE
jgi:hypothetical protein